MQKPWVEHHLVCIRFKLTLVVAGLPRYRALAPCKLVGTTQAHNHSFQRLMIFALLLHLPHKSYVNLILQSLDPAPKHIEPVLQRTFFVHIRRLALLDRIETLISDAYIERARDRCNVLVQQLENLFELAIEYRNVFRLR